MGAMGGEPLCPQIFSPLLHGGLPRHCSQVNGPYLAEWFWELGSNGVLLPWGERNSLSSVFPGLLQQRHVDPLPEGSWVRQYVLRWHVGGFQVLTGVRGSATVQLHLWRLTLGFQLGR